MSSVKSRCSITSYVLARRTGGGCHHRDLHFEVIEWRLLNPLLAEAQYIVSDVAFVGRTFWIKRRGGNAARRLLGDQGTRSGECTLARSS